MPEPPPAPFRPSSARQKSGHLYAQEDWATAFVAQAHDDALQAFGELTLFVLMWTLRDFQDGRVVRCSRCFSNDADGSVAAVYKQSSLEKCPVCYGSTYEGGWKAQLVRPAIWDFSTGDESIQSRGVTYTTRSTISTTGDFALNDYDYAVRSDNTRWRCNNATAGRSRTGFGQPGSEVVVGMNYSECFHEDASSVAYMIPLIGIAEDLLTSVNAHFPFDAGTVDTVRGPIL